MSHTVAQHPSHKSLKLLSCLTLHSWNGSLVSRSTTPGGGGGGARARAQSESCGARRLSRAGEARITSSCAVLRRFSASSWKMTSQSMLNGLFLPMNAENARIELGCQLPSRNLRRSRAKRMQASASHQVSVPLARPGQRLDLLHRRPFRRCYPVNVQDRFKLQKLSRRGVGGINSPLCKWRLHRAQTAGAHRSSRGPARSNGRANHHRKCLLDRARKIAAGGYSFRTASVSDRLMISTLQRMYRHFYFRLCDIVDTTTLWMPAASTITICVQPHRVAGIREAAAATYLAIVSDYAQCYRGLGTRLTRIRSPNRLALVASRSITQKLLRVPIMPQSARLYGSRVSRNYWTAARISPAATKAFLVAMARYNAAAVEL